MMIAEENQCFAIQSNIPEVLECNPSAETSTNAHPSTIGNKIPAKHPPATPPLPFKNSRPTNETATSQRHPFYQDGDENLISETQTIRQPMRNYHPGGVAAPTTGSSMNISRQEGLGGGACAIQMFGSGIGAPSNTSLQFHSQQKFVGDCGGPRVDPCSSELVSEQYDGLSQTAKKLKQASLRGIKPKMGRF